MSNKKKEIREKFRNDVFSRDKFRCRTCNAVDDKLDAHHITDRNEMPFGGYVKENGISLCQRCHEVAEVYHSTGTALGGWSPEDLYRLIGSSEKLARLISENKLK